MNCVIFDIDNCLADDRHRIPLIDRTLKGEAQWRAYHEACDKDLPHAPHVALLRSWFDSGRAIAYVTGRPISVADKTLQWLNAFVGIVDRSLLLMRDSGDEGLGSVELKRRKLALLRSWGYKVMAAYDDREDIVEMYRQEGLHAQVLRIHDDMSPHDDIEAQAPDATATSADDDDVMSLANLRPDKAAQPKWDAADILKCAAATFRARNEQYGAAYKSVGAVLQALFPSGLTLRSQEEFGRFAAFFMLVGKAHRYAAAWDRGGHIDSAHDAAVYAAMLEELTQPLGDEERSDG